LKAAFDYKQRHYTYGFFQIDSLPELKLNSEGKILVIEPGQTTGLLGSKREDATEELSKPHFYNLVQAALSAGGSKGQGDKGQGDKGDGFKVTSLGGRHLLLRWSRFMLHSQVAFPVPIPLSPCPLPPSKDRRCGRPAQR